MQAHYQVDVAGAERAWKGHPRVARAQSYAVSEAHAAYGSGKEFTLRRFAVGVGVGVVVAFSGTQGLTGWARNATTYEPLARRAALAALTKGARYLLVGHSQGGGVAQYAAHILETEFGVRRRDLRVLTYNSAPPWWGTFAESRDYVYNTVTAGDPLAWLPTWIASNRSVRTVEAPCGVVKVRRNPRAAWCALFADPREIVLAALLIALRTGSGASARRGRARWQRRGRRWRATTRG